MTLCEYPEFFESKEIFDEAVRRVDERLKAGEDNNCHLYKTVGDELRNEIKKDLGIPEPPVNEEVIRSNAIKEMSDNRVARGSDSYDATGE